MSDMGDDFSALREHNRIEREIRRNEGTGLIGELRKLGYFVQELTPYHFRVNSKIDLFPTRRRWHDLRDGSRGSWGQETAVQLVTRKLEVAK